MKKENKKGLLSRVIIFLVIFGFLIYLDARYVGTKGLVIREEAITSEKLPEAFNGFKIVHFSDLHYGTTVFLEELENLVDKINLLNPDIVVFTGDLIDKNYKLTDEEKNDIINVLKKINPKEDVYAVRGNHDSNDYFESIMSLSNIILLDNSNVNIYNGSLDFISLIGLDDYLEGNLDLSKAYEGISDDSYKIMLTHAPDVIDKLDTMPDLILAGHSHNGQVRIPFMPPLFKVNGARTYNDEKYVLDNSLLYISGGVGTSKYPLRLFNKPSINLYRFYSK